MRPIYNAPSTKKKGSKDETKKSEKPASYFMPLHMQHCLKMSNQQSNRNYSAEASKLNSKNNFKLTEMDSYKSSKKLSTETSVKNYKKGAKDAVEKFKGSQNLGYDNPEIQRHRRVQENASSILYKEDYEYEKDQIYYMPAENQQSKINSDVHYKKKFEEQKKQNKYNACETMQYKEQKQKHDRDINYSKEWESTKHKCQTATDSVESQRVKQVNQLRSDRAYKQQGQEALKGHNHNAGLLNRGDIAQSVHSQQTADVLNKKYREGYETEKTNYEFQKTLSEVPEIRHNIEVSKTIVDATNSNYSSDAKKTNASNEYTKSFCDTDQYKNAKKITEITRDSIYQAGKDEMIKTHQGFQSLNIREIPQFQQHEANQQALSNTRYREEWEEEKEAIYFPAHVSQGYEEKQRAQEAISESKYKKEAFDKMKVNKFNVAESEQYQKNDELRKHQSEVHYKAQFERERNNFTSLAVTNEMEKAKELGQYKDLKYREQYEKEKGYNTFNLDATEFQAAKNLQTLASDRQYQQVYMQGAEESEEESDDEQGYTSEDERVYREYMERLRQEEQEEQEEATQVAAQQETAENSDSDEDYEEERHFQNADGYSTEQHYNHQNYDTNSCSD